jgi:hypothetical protein
MMTRKIVLIMAAATLAGCASTNAASDQSAGVQKTVYVVDSGTNAGGAKPSTVPNVAGESKPMRIFWFLGGR